MPGRTRKKCPPAPKIAILGDWYLVGRDRNHNYYERDTMRTDPATYTTGTDDEIKTWWKGTWNNGVWSGEWQEPHAEKQKRRDNGDGLNYQDNATGEWTPYEYVHTDTPTIHPEVKKDFPAGESFCEETVYARKYARLVVGKQPLVGFAWRGETGEAEDEVWLNLRAVGASLSVVPAVGAHSVTWTEAWPDVDLGVVWYDSDGWEFRLDIGPTATLEAVQWTVKPCPGGVVIMDPENPDRPSWWVNGVKAFTFGPVRVFVDGLEVDDFPLPTWEIIPGDQYDILQLTLDPVALASAWADGTQTIQVRC